MDRFTNILIQLAWQSKSQMDVLRGIQEFLLLRPRWAIHICCYPDELDVRDQDALILSVPLPDQRVAMPKFEGPVVSIMANDSADVCIERDNTMIGEMAAESFLARGFSHLAFVSVRADGVQWRYSPERQDSFVRAAKRRGIAVLQSPAGVETWTPGSAISEWLKRLPRPCGIFCATDLAAMDVLAMCRWHGIAVPEELAVLGCDNDEYWCETAKPPLSSVSIPWRKVGYTTAEWVDRLLMGGKPPRSRYVLIEPTGVVVRQSTDVVAISQPELARALQYTRDHACEGITVKELLDAVGIERRRLYALFTDHLGRTPHEEIRRIQTEKAKELLVNTDLPQREICRAIGLSMVYFNINFRKIVGMSPGAYRAEHRLRDAKALPTHTSKRRAGRPRGRKQ
jgi:LacI family transcriptional regulator